MEVLLNLGCLKFNDVIHDPFNHDVPHNTTSLPYLKILYTYCTPYLSRFTALDVNERREARRSPAPTLLIQLPLGPHCPIILQVPGVLQSPPREGPLVGRGRVQTSSLQQALDVRVSGRTAAHHGQPHLRLLSHGGGAWVRVTSTAHAPSTQGGMISEVRSRTTHSKKNSDVQGTLETDNHKWQFQGHTLY